MEWNARWWVAPGVEDVRKVFPNVGTFCPALSIRDRNSFTLFMKFIMSKVYLGSLHLPQDDMFDELCPICGNDLSRQQILEECRGLALEREFLYRTVPKEHLSNLEWLARFRERPLSHFLLMVQDRFALSSEIKIRSDNIQSIPSVD